MIVPSISPNGGPNSEFRRKDTEMTTAKKRTAKKSPTKGAGTNTEPTTETTTDGQTDGDDKKSRKPRKPTPPVQIERKEGDAWVFQCEGTSLGLANDAAPNTVKKTIAQKVSDGDLPNGQYRFFRVLREFTVEVKQTTQAVVSD